MATPTPERDDDILPPFDIADFNDVGLELPQKLRTPDSLIARLNQATNDFRNDAHGPAIAQNDGQLFPGIGLKIHTASEGIKTQCSSKLWSIVRRAYADVRSERSIDYVVADPEANILFLQRCWELGAAASPFELNWILMNARKDGKLGSLPRAKRFSITKEELDCYSFAVDMAMRSVQERLYYSEQREVSIDHVLCDPVLANEFDDFTKQLVPEQSRFACRWTSITLRKARRSCAASFHLPKFDSFGLLEDVRMQKLPITCGTYWIRTPSGSLFTGVATNLRTQIDCFLQRVGHSVTPPWLKENTNGKPEIILCGADSYEGCEVIRAGVFKYAGSRLNFWNGSFFGNAA